MMKAHTATLFSLVAILVLALGLLFALMVTAQEAERSLDRQPGTPYFPRVSASGGHQLGTLPRPVPSDAVQRRDAAAPAIDLGEPGLSFRHVQTFGVTEEPYPADAQHFYQPSGIFVDGSNALYVVEEYGFRLLKFNAAGANQLIVGHAGLPWHHDDYLSWPKDMAVASDGHMWVVMGHALKEFEAGGSVIQRFPDSDPWNPGDDNEHFDNPAGIAFDSAGRLYVSDWWNHRVQVYTFTVEGGLVYSATIGVTDESGADNDHLNEPQRIAVYSNWLYIADAANHRVQIYDTSNPSATYFATIGVSGEPGSDNDHLAYPSGVAVDANYIYVAEGDNNRVQIFDRGTRTYVATLGEYGDGDYQFWNPRDVAIDTAGNIYVADYLNMRVQKFNSSRVYQGTYGMTGVPYATDAVRYNAPWGIAVATDGSLYFTENRGHRLVKLNAAGVQQWTAGEAGIWGSDNAHFGDLAGNPAIDAAGRIYVTDSWNHRIQILNSDGSHFATFGSQGTGDYQFECPTGVAISPVTGDIYVADTCNQRIMVYDSSRGYRAQVGVTDEAGSDDTHFNEPQGVAIDQTDAIYVADRWNYRVQKCTVSGTSYTCTTFAGVTGESGDDFDHLGLPLAVAVDGVGRVYVADEWNSRIQIFDSTGAYLTTIGGSGGTNSGQFNGPLGVAVDQQGNVYAADTNNHRIQKFARGVPGWRQVNINGFGDGANGCMVTLASFSGALYAGTWNWSGNGAQLWRTGSPWTAVMTNGFGTGNAGINDLVEFKGDLYASTADNDTGGEIWRSPNGLDWTRVVSEGLGNLNNRSLGIFAIFGNTLYVDAPSYTETYGTAIWRSSDGLTWTNVVTNGFDGDVNNKSVASFEVFGGYLYAGTSNSWDFGGEVWRTDNGITWTQVNQDGFVPGGGAEIRSLASFNGYLYATTEDDVWRCQVCDNSDWVEVVHNTFGNEDAGGMTALEIFDGQLYFVEGDWFTGGLQVWRTPDGVNWEQVGFAGFGDSNNAEPGWGGSVTVFGNRFFVGTCNWANGGEVWLYLPHSIYLPVALKNHMTGHHTYSDGTTSATPSSNPSSYIVTGYNAPYATPRSIEIHWPLSSDITSSTVGVSTLKFWGKGVGGAVTHLHVNGHDVGAVHVGAEYDWCTLSFSTAYLDQGADNVIEIWTSNGHTDVACDAPAGDPVGQPNAYYVRNNGGTVADEGPDYGEIYAQLAVGWNDPGTCFPLYSDDFGDPNSGWSVVDNPNVTFDYLNGEYRILVKDALGWGWVTHAPLVLADYVLEADLRYATTITATAGLVFDAIDVHNYHYFALDNHGKYSLWKYADGWHSLIDWTAASGFHPYPQSNRLKAVREGTAIKLYLNGRFLGSASDSTFYGGPYAGFQAAASTWPNVDVRFDNLAIYEVDCQNR